MTFKEFLVEMKYRGIRYPKTQQERREDPNPRVKRGKNLPTSYDDLDRGTQRSWKKHRKTQYK